MSLLLAPLIFEGRDFLSLLSTHEFRNRLEREGLLTVRGRLCFGALLLLLDHLLLLLFLVLLQLHELLLLILMIVNVHL